jgi:hypothetical protein
MRTKCGAIGLLMLTSCVGDIGGEKAPPDGPESVTQGDPNRITIHRLNRVEYNNTVRDLLGTSLTPADDFPADDHSLGFDNIADALTISPVQFELYERAAETLTEDALAAGVASLLERHEAEDVGGSVGSASGEGWTLTSNGEVSFTQAFPAAGQYTVRARVWQDQAGPADAQMTISVGSTVLGPFDVTSTEPTVIEETVDVAAGSSIVSVAFLNDYYDPDAGADRNLHVDYIEVEGGAGAGSPLRERIVTCDFAVEGEPCLRQILGDFGERAWRRPLEDSEIDALLGVAALASAQGDSVEEGLKLAVRAILTSPHFLFRVELDPDPASDVSHALGEFELASRLSYFMWSSMPDDELFSLAHAGTLSDPATLDAQIDRMLDDDKSSAIIENFAGQWLFTRALAEHEPNYEAFPDYDAELRDAMKIEADMFFGEFLRNDERSLSELLAADFTFVNDKLAAHYGMSGSFGPEFSQVSLTDSQRGGLMKQGAWLTVTSNPDRTSPVKRGKWVLENLLCSAPPPPPPGVEGFKPTDVEAKTQRELLAAHRADPTCNSCHETMDNIGLGLENYDGIGAFRTDDKGVAIDASGVLYGQTFASPDELVAIITADEQFSSCAVKKMFTYALGRGAVPSDNEYFGQMSEDFRAGGMKLRQLVKLVVMSEPFRFRRGEPTKGGE